ncbi:rifin [Plasmodium reichenowi]|uniref:Rifin n=1 Tax=Plasmodium reichenowi TaxID=5854 RepID=A0A060RMN9_PLARE|nr:rifin [Plasmodium reichenowi]
MKIHYINKLLFSLSLNMLLSSQVYNQRNHNSTTYHTPKIPTTRLLCECELYAPANYDNDPEMKKVIENFNKQTQQRFEEYDDRMQSKRKHCKDKCDKEIQKIILKDNLEKELMDKFSTLQTDIQSDSIPTCVFEKSMADKTEKFCLKCGYGLGSNVPLVGLISGIGFYTGVLKYAVDYGISEGTRIAASKGIKVAIELLTDGIPGIGSLFNNIFSEIVTETTYNSPMRLGQAVHGAVQSACSSSSGTGSPAPIVCGSTNIQPQKLYPTVANISAQASQAGKEAGAAMGKVAQERAWNAAFTWETFFSSPLGISIIVTVCIVVMLIIIYLILRYRRKKKMKKKLQYIKLLKE